MKRKWISSALAIGMACSVLTACANQPSTRSTVQNQTKDVIENESSKDNTTIPSKSNNQSLEKITLNEVAHSIFYAPMYVAIENGYFKDEGIDLDLVCGFGADKVMTALLSNEAQIGFMGSEASIYTANEGAEDLIVNFAQLTQRAGNFLVARESVPEFSWNNLQGNTVIGGRKGGVHTSM